MPVNSFDSVPESLTQRALAHNFSVEEKTRREEALLNKDFYYDKQEQQLTLVNDDVNPAVVNLTKPVVKKRTTLLYRKPLKRELEGPQESVNFIEQVYKDNHIDTLLQQADLLSELTGSCLIHTTPNTEMPSGIELRLFDASEFSPVTRGSGKVAEAISLVRLEDRLAKGSTAKQPQVERVLVQEIWTRSAVVIYEGTVKNPTQGNILVHQEENPLGFLPFMNWRSEVVPNQFLGHAQATGIRKLNEVANQMLTDLGYTMKMQGFTPIAVSGYQSGEAMSVHPGRFISLPAQAQAFVLSTQPKIAEMLTTLQEVEDKIFETNQVPKVAVVGGEGQSGRELLVRFYPLLQVFQEKTVLYKMNELDLANMILKTQGMEPLESISIDFPEDDVIPFNLENDTLGDDLVLGLRTPIDELMSRDPDLSEQEAEALIRANLDINRELLTPTGQQGNAQ